MPRRSEGTRHVPGMSDIMSLYPKLTLLYLLISRPAGFSPQVRNAPMGIMFHTLLAVLFVWQHLLHMYAMFARIITVTMTFFVREIAGSARNVSGRQPRMTPSVWIAKKLFPVVMLRIATFASLTLRHTYAIFVLSTHVVDIAVCFAMVVPLSLIHI